jgi:hypothetical protein
MVLCHDTDALEVVLDNLVWLCHARWWPGNIAKDRQGLLVLLRKWDAPDCMPSSILARSDQGVKLLCSRDSLSASVQLADDRLNALGIGPRDATWPETEPVGYMQERQIGRNRLHVVCRLVAALCC